MRSQSIIFFASFLLVYVAANYYAAFRYTQFFPSAVNFIGAKWYWLSVAILALSFFLGRMNGEFIGTVLKTFFSLIGGYWLIFLYYSVLALLLIDISRLLFRFLSVTHKLMVFTPTVGLMLLAVIFALLIVGTINARSPVVRHYDVTIHKNAKDFSDVRIVAISDIHLGNIINKKRLAILVEEINALNPDVVVLAGDVIDEDIEPFVRENMQDELLKIKAPLGTYVCLGNHEYLSGHPDECAELYRQAGVEVLRDRVVEVKEAFYIIGRDDKSMQRRTGQNRLATRELIKSTDQSLPLILLDHQPVDIDENADLGIDLQLSGHTHLGQVFPNNLITKKVFKVDWGYYSENNYNLIVSNGFGTWGPPVRIGNRPEILDIMVRFHD